MAELSPHAGKTPEQALADTTPPSCRFVERRATSSPKREIVFRGIIVLVCLLTIAVVVLLAMVMGFRRQISDLSDRAGGNRRVNCENWMVLHPNVPVVEDCLHLPPSPSQR